MRERRIAMRCIFKSACRSFDAARAWAAQTRAGEHSSLSVPPFVCDECMAVAAYSSHLMHSSTASGLSIRARARAGAGVVGTIGVDAAAPNGTPRRSASISRACLDAEIESGSPSIEWLPLWEAAGDHSIPNACMWRCMAITDSCCGYVPGAWASTRVTSGSRCSSIAGWLRLRTVLLGASYPDS